jgi:hypothetical protein
MKIKVKPEGREDVWIPEKESVKQFILDKKLDPIHNFVAGGSMVIGADHDQKSVLEDIDKAERLAILTGSAQGGNLGHALALIINNKLEMYDIGEITEKDLEITNL